MKLLLINPQLPETLWSFRWLTSYLLPRHQTVHPPLGLATVAALTPAHWEVQIIDANIHGVPLTIDADVVGVGGMGIQYREQVSWLDHFRKQGIYTVAGGSYVSLCPEQYVGHADTLIVGEAEYQWPRFCRDFEHGNPVHAYIQRPGTVDVTDSPLPRFDLLDWRRYFVGSVQFSRGCPFQCDFCDIPVLYGRRPRTKTLVQLRTELDALTELDVKTVFFVDDNLVGHLPHVRELFKALDTWRFDLNYGTEASINVARYPDVLTDMRRAGFEWVFIGFETPSAASLKLARKTQNIGLDMIDACHDFYAHGIQLYGGFMVGFDTDGPEIFDEQYHFIQQSGIQFVTISPVMAIPKTPLFNRLKAEDRLVDDADFTSTNNTAGYVNIKPKLMTRRELREGYFELYRRLYSSRAIARRLEIKLSYLRDPVLDPANRHYTASEVQGIGGRLRRALDSIDHPSDPVAVKDWVLALSVRDFIERHHVSQRKHTVHR